MTPVSQWDGSASANAVVARPRLRRTDRLILGSFDGGAHALQQQARIVLLGSGLLMLPMMALNLLFSVLAFTSFSSFDNLLADRGYLGVERGSVFVAIVVQSFTAHLIGAYSAAFLVRFQLGEQPTMGQCLGAVVRRLPMLLLTWMLTHWWAFLIALAVINAPSAFVGLLLYVVPLAAMFSAMVALVTPVLMTEHSGVRCIPRAIRLTRTRFGAVYGFVLTCGLISGSLFVFIADLPSLLEQTQLVTFGSYGYLVQGVTLQLALLVAVPLSALATAQLYLQLRVHAEGIDLSLAAREAFGGRS